MFGQYKRLTNRSLRADSAPAVTALAPHTGSVEIVRALSLRGKALNPMNRMAAI